MATTNHYHDQIQRATERLVQLQAKELLANQRREAKARETARREEVQRRQRVADIVFLAGAQTLNDKELETLLASHMRNRVGSLH
ncbi:hypothetical protein XarbCFBP8138_03310 [Xanthomonas arboricola]|uniref:hypothetical protein n=1 Tax=Xanthomonas arboricola TaxID=56448 RepID=UPI000CEEEF42|nr:hypothetical protein [Xanthomonas arboricola]PPT57873.1 hypothetical protein XarbCFBP8138_03310 [Xanthomonas arboricola]